MKNKSIQILVTEKEYALLEQEANHYCLPISLYIKSKVLPDEGFAASYQKLLDKVDALPVGTKFKIASLFGVEWTMPLSVRLSLGRVFNDRISRGIIKNVMELERDSDKVMWYQKL